MSFIALADVIPPLPNIKRKPGAAAPQEFPPKRSPNTD